MTRHPATVHLSDPDLVGDAGAAWMVDLPLSRAKPEQSAALAGWLATIPGAHLLWHSYAINVVHLRPIIGAPPAHLKYPTADHELAILALDPDQPLSDPKDGEHYRFRYLTPPNLVLQFHGVSDGQAQGLARHLAVEFVSGFLSPDTDHRRLIIAAVKGYLTRFGGKVGP